PAVVARQRRETPGRLDGPEQRVVGVLDARAEPGRDALGDDQRRDVVAAAAVVVVPGDRQQGVLRREGRGAEDGRDVVLQPGVAGRHGAIVHVVAHVRRDPGVVRGGPG